MIYFDKDQFLNELMLEHSHIYKKNKRFFNTTLPVLVEKRLKADSQIKIYEADEPFKIDRCPKCKTPVVYGDNFCANCGVNFQWR